MSRKPSIPLLIAALLLTACDSPSPAMRASRNATIDVGGMTFGVHWTDSEAEIYRTGWARRDQWAQIPANAEIATEKVTGCEVTSMDGDPALMTARLKCPRSGA
jgi:hypothetical protein